MQRWRFLPNRAAWIVLSAMLAVGSVEPASGTSRAYYCFFDRGSARVTDRCRQIVSDMAHAWRVFHDELAADHSGVTTLPALKETGRPGLRIVVNAYAPDAKSPEAGTQLSLMRALAVAGELRSAGVPEEFITPVGFGNDIPPYGGFPQNEPLDPQNRVGMMNLY